jgi:hypothetical protein
VRATGNGEVFLGLCPGGCGSLDRGSTAAKVVENRSCWVREGLDVCGKIGRGSEMAYHVFKAQGFQEMGCVVNVLT